MKRRRRRRRSDFEFNPKYLWIFCIILCVVLMFVSYRFPERFSGVKTFAGNVMAPMQRGINSVGRGISDKLEAFRSVKALRAENEELKERIEVLIATNQSLTQDKYELDGLRRLYELDAKYMDYDKVAARVIASDTNNWFYSFIVDKGSEDGIKVGMNVMAGNGLVGIVSETGKNWSRIRSIIDDNCNVSGMSIETQDTCIVSGDLKLMKEQGVIRVEMISMDASFQDDYEIVTSHISDKYLQGILIGYIQDIKVDSSNMTKTAYLIPAVDFERLDEVLIVTELKEAYDFK
ncbi:MAG: rod shape-determining protein MreC [Lachnospiraceae bacterium]|nr:rod shape-determining protein MreC [Lachnospiraceae bacterium]